MGPALFCMPLLPVLKRTQAEFRIRLPTVDGTSIGMMEITTDTVEVESFLQCELSNIGMAINPTKMLALAPKGGIPTPEPIALLEDIGVRVAEQGVVKVVGVPVGTDEHARESAMGR